MQSKISFFTHSHRFFLKDKNNKSQQQTQNGDKIEKQILGNKRIDKFFFFLFFFFSKHMIDFVG